MADATQLDSMTQSIALTISRLRIDTALQFTSATVLIYDYLLTVHLEEALIWSSSWSYIKVLFLINRYLPFVDITLGLYYNVVTDISLSACKYLVNIIAWCYLAEIFLAETILSIRTWAIWGKRRSWFIAFSTFFACWFIILVVLVVKFVTSWSFKDPLPGFSACANADGQIKYISITYILISAYEAVFLILMCIWTGRMYKRGSATNLWIVISRDGILYYMILFTLAAVTSAVILTLPREFTYLLALFQLVLHSVLTSRVILHIRERAYLTMMQTSTLRAETTVDPHSILEFASQRPHLDMDW